MEIEHILQQFTAIRTKRASEVVADQIRKQLVGGTLRPGDRLPSERELAEQFNLSRNTVREGLRALEVSGVLELRKGATGGAFIRNGQGETIINGFADLFRLGMIKPDHLTEGRLIVGAAVTRLACQRATIDDLERLQENIRASQIAVEAGNLDERTQINLEFHRLLARAAKNPVLIVLTDALIEIQTQLLEVYKPASNDQVMPARRRLMQQLLARNEQAAVAEMEDHLRNLQAHYLEQANKVSKRKHKPQ